MYSGHLISINMVLVALEISKQTKHSKSANRYHTSALSEYLSLREQQYILYIYIFFLCSF